MSIPKLLFGDPAIDLFINMNIIVPLIKTGALWPGFLHLETQRIFY